MQKNDFFYKLMGFVDLELLENSAKELSKKVKSDCDVLIGRERTNNSNLLRLENQLKSLPSVDNLRIESESKLNQKKKELSDLQNNLNDIKIQDQDSIDKIRKELTSARNSKTKIFNEISPISNKLTTTNNDIFKIKKTLESLKKGKCPTCGQSFSDEKFEEEQQSNLEKLLEERNDLEKELQNLNSQKNEATTKETRLQHLVSDYDDSISKTSILKDKILRASNEISELEKRSILLNDDDIEKKKIFIQAEIDSAKQEAIELSKERQESDEKLATTQVFVNKFFRLGNGGILVEKLNENTVNILQEELSLISDFQLKVMPDLSLKIKFNNDYLDYNSCSAGQKRYADVLSLIAISNIFSKYHNLKNGLLGIAMMDELFIYFDNDLLQFAISLLDSLITNNILIISHENLFGSSFDSIVNVSLDENGNSVYGFLKNG
jgi:DNA repair exonuclease SbcCD ATPase subunit